jgi:hypothetical protein
LQSNACCEHYADRKKITGFTLADEALQTSRQDHSSWAANSILRSKPVKFISAGTSEPLKALSNLSKPADVQKLPSSSSQEGNRLSDVGTLDVIVGPVPLSSEVHSKDELLSGEELRRDLDVSHGPETRSEDCGFFFDLGTKAQRSVSPKSPLYLPARSLSPCSSSSDEVILFKGRDAPKREDLTTGLTFSQSHITTQSSKDERKFTSMAKVSRQSAEVNRPARERFGKLLDQNDSGNDALVADYIENMRENGEIDGLLLSDTRNMRDLGGSESMSTRSHSDKDDFKDENQGDMGVRSENRSQEKQGQEASTLPGNLDIDVSLEGKCNNSDMYRSEGELDDETLARLIAGQDLGPDNDYDPDDIVSSDSDDSLSFSKQTTTRPYPNVDEFDYMDWNRASLHRKKGKAARAKFAFSVSDSELEQTLQVAWNHDRMRKAQRKQQREELRALGQLGRGSEKPDLKVKYSTGMNMQQVAEEFKAFLLGNEDRFVQMNNA